MVEVPYANEYTITNFAGKLTPAARVDVQNMILILPFL